MKPEEMGANDACCACDDPEKKVCRMLMTMQTLGLYYKGLCGRDTKTGVILTGGDVNGETKIQGKD